MNLLFVYHTTIANMSQTLRNAIGSSFVQESDRLPMKLYTNLFLLCLKQVIFKHI
jgi:hypothetical protein